jgi:hypothetical protein
VGETGDITLTHPLMRELVGMYMLSVYLFICVCVYVGCGGDWGYCAHASVDERTCWHVRVCDAESTQMRQT